MSPSSKYKAQRKHAKQRFIERHGFYLTDEDLNFLRGCIKRNRGAIFVSRTSNRVSIWDVDFKGRTVRVVYDKNRGNIVTVLPPLDYSAGEK